MKTFNLKNVENWAEPFEKELLIGDKEINVKEFLEIPGITLGDCWIVEQEFPGFIKGNFRLMAMEVFERYKKKLPHPIMDFFWSALEKREDLNPFKKDIENLRSLFASSNVLKNLLEICQIFIEWKDLDLYYASIIFYKGTEMLGEKEIEEQKKTILKYLEE